MSRLLHLIILGPPGAGKGTISNRIVSRFQLTHVASGDVLRSHVARETEVGRVAKEFLIKGQLVPDHVILNLMLHELQSHTGHNWLLDGFPRTVPQARGLSEHHDVDAVINLNVPFDTIISRIKERWVHSASGRIYNLSYNPPRVAGRDDITGELLEQRDDDSPVVVAERLKQYEMLTAPLVHHYQELSILRTFTGTESDVIWPCVQDFVATELLHGN